MLEATRCEYEIVFVDDGSVDGTGSCSQELCATTPRCRSIFHERNRGRGGAFKTGFAATSGRITGFLDIDLEVPAHYVPPLVNLIEHHGVDVATGRRHYLLRQTLALHRVMLSWVYRRMLKAVVGWDIRDSETGCKFFRRETAAGVVMQSEEDGWFWDTEVMARAVLADLQSARDARALPAPLGQAVDGAARTGHRRLPGRAAPLSRQGRSLAGPEVSDLLDLGCL